MKIRWILVLLLVWSSLVFGQAMMQLGPFSFTNAAAPNFRQVVNSSPRFFRGTGGVAFSATAEGEAGQSIESIKYHFDRPDGKRIVTTIKSKQGELVDVTLDLYDWEFKPIYEFSDSKYGAAMTLFGELENKNDQEELQNEGAKFLNYHESLSNTLVGLRLMQADLLLINKELAVSLPTVEGQYILGDGETPPKLEKNSLRYEKVYTELLAAKEAGDEYSSYVIGDRNEEIKFSVNGEKLLFTGLPRWTFWSEADSVIDARNSFFMASLLATSEDMSAIENSENPLVTLATLSDWFSVEDAQTLIKYQESGNDAPIVHKDSMSEKISKTIADQAGINPTVYKLVKKVMHYRAFFTNFKKEQPVKFKELLIEVNKLRIEPTVTTPTVMHNKLLH